MMEEKIVRKNEDMEIDLLEIGLILLRHLPIILPVGIMTALLAFLFTHLFIAPVYQSTTKIYILSKQENSNVTYSDLQMGSQLTKDYAELIQSRFVLEEVIQELDLPLGYEGLSSKVSVTTPTDTRVLSITVSDEDPVLAMKIANAIREASSVHIMNVMDIQAVNVVETANMPMYRSSPSIGKNVCIGGFLGIFLVAAAVIVRYLMDDTIKTTEDVEKYLGISVLAQIPLIEEESGPKKKKKRKAKRKKAGK